MLQSAKAAAGFYWPAFFFILLAALIQVAGAPLTEYLRYEREAILSGQLWRLLTGHLVHLGWIHLLLNIAGLLFLCFGFASPRHGSATKTLVSFIAIMLGLSGALLLFSPELSWYVGLSGVLHGWWALLAIRLWPREGLMAMLLLAVLFGKIAWEQVTGADAALAERIGGDIVIDAHLYGMLSGLFLSALEPISGALHRLSSNRPPKRTL